MNIQQKVSIHIPAYNAERTIEKSLNSLFEQTIPFDEIIVINDNSTDQTFRILKNYKEINIINNKTNMGLSFNRNEAIKNSKNDIIASIDADVVLDKFWLEKLLFHLKKPEILMCGGRMEEMLINNNFNIWRSRYYSQNWGSNDKKNPNFLFGCNTLQTKNIWKEINGYNEQFKTNGEDVDYSNKIKTLKKGDLYYCSDALCYHLQNDDLDSLSHRVWRYHAYGYKIKDPSFLRLVKLVIKQFKFVMLRVFENLIKFNFNFILISLIVFIKFIKFEIKYYRQK